MATSALLQANGDHTFFPRNGFLRVLLLGILFAGALGIRLYHIGDPPLDFHATRQYHSALLARAIYFDTSSSVTERDKIVALAAKPGVLEPPLMEHMTSWLYRIADRENLIIPRLMSILFWLVGAVFVYRLCVYGVSPDAALVSAAFFLFVPFGIYASRSFQPDPLMIMAVLGAVWAILRYRQVVSVRLFLVAIAFSALAVFVKPVCVFPICLAFLFTGITENGLWPTLRNTHSAVFLFLSLLPILLFYGYGMFVAGFLKGQAGGRFLPHLVTEGLFWKDWLWLALRVTGQGALVASLLGLSLVRLRLTKSLLAGMWGGYFVFGLVFTYHIHTHDYYHLMLIPIVAVSLGASAAALLRPLAATSGFWRWTVWGVLVFALLLYVGQAGRQLASPGAESQVQLYEEIGERVDHSTRTIFLSRSYGKPLQYHGRLAGFNWPPPVEFRVASLRGRQLQRGKELLDSLLLVRSPEYFIVTDCSELERQPDLKEALVGYSILVSTDEYRIYDLRKTPEDSSRIEVREGPRESPR